MLSNLPETITYGDAFFVGFLTSGNLNVSSVVVLP